MSKKSGRNNRPKRKKTQNSPKKGVNQAEQIDRRKWLKRALSTAGGVGTGIVLWRMGAFDVFKEEEEQGEKKTVAEESENTKSKFEIWSENFKLPKIEIVERDIDLAERNDRNIDTKRAFGFFDKAKDKLISDFRDDLSQDEKRGIIQNFLGKVIGAYIDATGEKIDNIVIGTTEFNLKIAEVNAMLSMHGYHIRANYDSDVNAIGVRILKIENVDAIRISEHSGKDIEIPFAYLKREGDYLEKKGVDIWDSNASYNMFGPIAFTEEAVMKDDLTEMTDAYIIRFQKAAGPQRMNFDPSKCTPSEYAKIGIQHEGMHAVLDIQGLKILGKARLRNEPVDTGRSILPKEAFSGMDNRELHEVIANGYGLYTSGNNAYLVAHALTTSSVKQKSYKYANSFFVDEMLASPFVDEELKKKAVTKNGSVYTVNFDDMIYMIDRTPLEELHRIGERMAKLGIYLAQE